MGAARKGRQGHLLRAYENTIWFSRPEGHFGPKQVLEIKEVAFHENKDVIERYKGKTKQSHNRVEIPKQQETLNSGSRGTSLWLPVILSGRTPQCLLPDSELSGPTA